MSPKARKSIIHIASVTCVIHCIVTPLLIVVAPFIGSIFAHHWIELSLLLISIPCGLFIIYKGYCTHKKWHALTLFIVGALLWLGHTLLEHHGDCSAKYYLFIGTGLVLASYYINHRYLKCCPSECCSH